MRIYDKANGKMLTNGECRWRVEKRSFVSLFYIFNFSNPNPNLAPWLS